MKTNELIDLLANRAGRVDAHVLPKRFGAAIAAGLAAALALMAVRFGTNPDLAEFATLPAWWTKVAFAAATAVAACMATARFARPGGRVGRVGWLVVAPAAILWLLAALALVDAAPGARASLLLGSSWRTCPFNIALLSVPVFVASLWALRGLAPTAPRRAGAASGLLAGAAGALVYCLHCPEIAAPFLAVWYLAGIVLPSFAGAALGPALLRW
jgi:hypothetical protein